MTRVSLLVALLFVPAAASAADPPVVSRIAFGSCAKQDKPQPIWDAVVETKPQHFVFLGDNIYADTEDMEVMKQKYALLGKQPGYIKLKATCPVRRIVRLIQKWLRAGVSENGQWSPTEVGTPQGAVASPLLANVYLHYVLDLWVHQWRSLHARGDVVVVRYADDFVIGFQHRHEAERFLADLKERRTCPADHVIDV